MTRREKAQTIQKTNAMRELEAAGVSFEAHRYDVDDSIPSGELGVRIAESLGENKDASFKTLVCEAPAGEYVVCCVPVAQELNLKKAASAAGKKSLSMLPVKDLEAVTGYVRGGCTPIGMKKQFPTLIDETAQLFDVINVSGGRKGLGITVSPIALASCIKATFADIVREARS
ncbi:MULTISPECIES: Cys-tRNA(Pro) deacylase [Atopobiaceae]|uniref:Cys-tRNA(Pro) deacylase n=1 Tax=Atopobiaceae TaxID=1643824 RepID=UPI00034EA242|nr:MULTISPECIES: Cys-tRNA(Pro) deacylase [Atopobiaceae]EPD78221.1 YbaK/EbsC protein [Atopobium sp. oral taxon 199 str. F0494]